jgi:hypothetical protein
MTRHRCASARWIWLKFRAWPNRPCSSTRGGVSGVPLGLDAAPESTECKINAGDPAAW